MKPGKRIWLAIAAALLWLTINPALAQEDERCLACHDDPELTGFRGDEEIQLTAKEFDLLDYLLSHPRQVLTRDQILERVWGYDFMGDSNIIEVYVRYLRQKTEFDELPRLNHTVRGVGYVLREDE